MAAERSVGLIETRGIVALTAGIEAMMKTADVQCTAVQRVSSGFYAAAVEGSVASVRQALESGTQAVRQYGELRSAQMYPRPHEVSVGVLDNGTRDTLAGDRAAVRWAPARAPSPLAPMILGEVVGRVWNDREVPELRGRRLLLVHALAGDEQLVAVDLIEVGAGDIVLVAQEEAAQAVAGAPVDAAVVALVAGADVLPGREEGAGASP